MSTVGPDLQAWHRTAEIWISQADRMAEITAGASDALVAALAPEPGQRLIDVAAGAGDPALRLARLVGPRGAILATDGVPAMCEELARRAAAAGLPQLAVRCVPAEQLDVPPGSFDGACCRFGAMFFADPHEALARMRRAVRADGRLVLAVWGAKEANPYFTLVTEAFDGIGAPAVPATGMRTVFEYAQPGLLAGLATAAGWQAVREDAADLSMTLPGTSPDTLLDTLASLSGRVGDRLALLPPADHAAARAAVSRGAQRLVRGADIVFPARILIVSGRAGR
ncbi:MAG TPA: methyltransferase domain-containing protein [Planctomycetota bacterium]|nr:methyltransferase domain-containing protein [Planctomycetota bacterium]